MSGKSLEFGFDIKEQSDEKLYEGDYSLALQINGELYDEINFKINLT